MNLMFCGLGSPTHYVTTRVVARDLLQGTVAQDATSAIDIDVSTPEKFTDSSPQSIKTWVDMAHTLEKAAFRKLIPDALYEKLRKNVDASIH
jgi:hypothetical protein